jgi:hypothetical protein
MGRPRTRPIRPTTATCEFCGASHPMTAESKYPYGHRGPSGEPCRGKSPIRIIESLASPRPGATARKDVGEWEGDDDA